MRKSLMFLGVICVAVLAMAPTAVERTFLKIEGLNGGIVDPMHQGWFQAESFSWGATQALKGPACLTGPGGGPHTLSFTRKGPALAKLAQLCAQHATLPSLTVEAGGERHLLQNVSFANCQSQISGNDTLDNVTLSYGRCATHDNSSVALNYSKNPALKIEQKGAPGIVGPDRQYSKIEQPNAILIGLSQNPEAQALIGLLFNGDGRSATLTRKAGGNQQDGLRRALQSKQTIPSLTLTLNNGQKWTFTNVTISSFTGGVKPGTESLSLNFTKVDGLATGFHDLSYK